MAATSSMFMYSLTVQTPTAVNQAIVGNFSGDKKIQEVLTASGSLLTLWQPKQNDTVFQPTVLMTHDTFGIIRSLAAFRIAGTIKDYILIGSDSGRITILEFTPSTKSFKRVHLETFGKSGVRRVIPGQYLVTDPKGRACMIASIEKNKLVYVLNRNAQAQLTISSPLEAHKAHALVFALIGLDVGYENPIFASLEVDYGDAEQDPSGQAYAETEKELVYYELDLGLNHVIRKWHDTVDRSANMLFQVPGGSDGPSGVLVCSEEFITYRHSSQETHRVAIPRRKGATEDPSRKRYITCGVVHRLRGQFFFLLQTEDGDLFKLTFEMVLDGNGEPTADVARVKLKYFDTIPPATSLCILKIGYLMVTMETGHHSWYQIASLGEDDETKEVHSDEFSDLTERYTPAYFHPRAPAENIILTEFIPSLNPMMGLKTVNLTNDDAPQIYSICGTGARSSLTTLKHGLSVLDLVDSGLGQRALNVWTVPLKRDDTFDAYAIIAFDAATVVLEIKDEVEQTDETGILTTVRTLSVQQMGEDSLVQVHPKGIRHIEGNGRINDWPAPQHRTIVAAAANVQQIAVALSSGEIVYFEMDSDGSLNQFEDTKAMTATVTCLGLGPVPDGRIRTPWLAVGCDDSTVRILSLDPESTLQSKSVQALSSAPSSICVMFMEDYSSGGKTMYLHIGLHSGVYIRTVLDEVTGEISDTRTRFLGSKPIKLRSLRLEDQTVILALSTRSWVGYTDSQTRMFTLAPLDFPQLESGSGFHSANLQYGIVGIHEENLRIFQITKLTTKLLQEHIALQYTPRKFVHHPKETLFYVIEADNNTLSAATREQLLGDPGVVNGDSAALPPEETGYSRGNGHWASAVQIVDPVHEKAVAFTFEGFDYKEAPTSIAYVQFEAHPGDEFLLVGTGVEMVASPRSYKSGWIHVFRLRDNGRSMEIIHKTKVDEPPLALLAFQGRVIVGVGKNLVLYDLGQKQLLRKCQAVNAVPNLLTDLQTQGSRIICSDVQESVTYVVYKHGDNRLLPFADDTVARWTSAAAMVDYETTAGGDKFGNLWLVRCPGKVSEEADEDGAVAHLVHDKPYLQGTSSRLDLVAHFFTQDIPIAIQKIALVAGGKDVLLWGGLQGTIGVIIPFEQRDDANFFSSLEEHMRKVDAPIAGRDHLIYRSYYIPVKGVIDGDLIERFMFLPRPQKESIAADLDRDVREVERKIGDMRTRFAY